VKRSDVLYEDNHLLVVNKPAGMVTQGAGDGHTGLVEHAKQYIGEKYDKPGNVYIGIVSRLDMMTSGVIVLARTSKAAARLNEQFSGRKVQKTYWALVPGNLQPPSATLEDYIRKDESQHRMVACDENDEGARAAKLSYRILRVLEDCQLVEIQLETGRKHQIRVQFASRGFPVVGDRKYNSGREFEHGIALHSRRLQFLHPTKKTPLDFVAQLPASWRKHDIND
jgi:23S rRNA pseudouridine1911/1915/1917 synthase